MKVIKSLLKLSTITLSSAIVITNPGINSLLGVEQASAENYFDTRKYGSNEDVVKIIKTVVDKNIEASPADWAKKAIKGKTKWTESIDNLKTLISIYQKEASIDEKVAFDNHQGRMAMLSYAVNCVMKNELPNDRGPDIKIWQGTEKAKEALGMVNGMMACETLRLWNETHKEKEKGKRRELRDWVNSTGKYKDQGLFENVFEKISYALHNHWRNDNGTLVSNGATVEIWLSILSHFGYKGVGDKKNVEKSRTNAETNFKNYLFHDFKCYLKDIGIIEEIKAKDRRVIPALDLIDLTKGAQKLFETNIIKCNLTENCNTLEERVEEINSNSAVQTFFGNINGVLEVHNLDKIDVSLENLDEKSRNLYYLKSVDGFLGLYLQGESETLQNFVTKFINAIFEDKELIKDMHLTTESILDYLGSSAYDEKIVDNSLSGDKEQSEFITDLIANAKKIKSVAKKLKIRDIYFADLMCYAENLMYCAEKSLCLNEKIDINKFTEALKIAVDESQQKSNAKGTINDFNTIADLALNSLLENMNNLQQTNERHNASKANPAYADGYSYLNFKRLYQNDKISEEQFNELFSSLKQEHSLNELYSNLFNNEIDRGIFGTICYRYILNNTDIQEIYPYEVYVALSSLSEVQKVFEGFEKKYKLSNACVATVNKKIIDVLSLDVNFSFNDSLEVKDKYNILTKYVATYIIEENTFRKMLMILRKKLSDIKVSGEWYSDYGFVRSPSKIIEYASFYLILHKLGVFDKYKSTKRTSDPFALIIDPVALAKEKDVEILLNGLFN